MRTGIVVPDTHVPFHDKRAWNLLLKVIAETKPQLVVFVGDFVDFYSVSSHSKDPKRQLKLVDEVAAGNTELDRYAAIPGNRETIFCAGNHENRLERFIQDRAPELFGLTTIPKLFRFKERGWRYVPYGDFIKIGKMGFSHDIGRSGKNAAMQSLNDFGGNFTFGHTHRGGVVYSGTVKGESHVCLNVGWLGDPKAADYMHRAKANRDWQLGFGALAIFEDGDVHAQFVPIIRNRCVVLGKEYRG